MIKSTRNLGERGVYSRLQAARRSESRALSTEFPASGPGWRSPGVAESSRFKMKVPNSKSCTLGEEREEAERGVVTLNLVPLGLSEEVWSPCTLYPHVTQVQE